MVVDAFGDPADPPSGVTSHRTADDADDGCLVRLLMCVHGL
jgi:hypothetical protein